MDKALITADGIRQEMGFFNKELGQQILSQISDGLTPGQIKTKSLETRKVLRHGSAVRKKEVQNSEAVLKRHATTTAGENTTGKSVTSPSQSSRGSSPKIKRPTSQACSVM